MKYSQGEKHEIIRIIESSSLSVRRTLRQIGVSKSTFYEWYRRYVEGGFDGLSDRSRCASQFWNRIPEGERQAIVELALENPQLSCREVAVKLTDERGYFVSESSVYRILKARGLIVSPVFAISSAKDKFQHPPRRINELWQTDFTYFKIVGWGWYYLSTVMDDYSRMILSWKLCSTMSSEDVKQTLDVAIQRTGVHDARVAGRPRLLSDNGPAYISKNLRQYLKDHEMDHTRGKPFHPMTQGKIVMRSHRHLTLFSPNKRDASFASRFFLPTGSPVSREDCISA
jgi:transposase InsO family protein